MDTGLYNAKQPCKSLLTGPTISIFVGAERKHWTLHHKLLAFHSLFFTEFENEKLEFPKDDPAGWSLLVHYLYQGSLPSIAVFQSSTSKYEHAVACQKLYILCHRFVMPHLQNLAMDRFRECLHAAHLVPDAEEIHEMYSSSPKGSGMRKLMINIAARQIMDPDTERDVQAYHGCFEAEPDFAVGLVQEIRSISGGMLFRDPTSGESCEFHEHIEGGQCQGRKDSAVEIPRSNVVEMQTPEEPKAARAPDTPTHQSPSTSGDDQDPSRHISQSPARPERSIKLNGPGLKVRFVDRTKNPPAPSKDSSGHDEASPQASPRKLEIRHRTKDLGKTSSPPLRRVHPNHSILRPRHVVGPVMQTASGVRTRSLPSGRVDAIVDRYDTMTSKGGAGRPEEKPASQETSRRRPPKLRVSERHAHPLKEEKK